MKSLGFHDHAVARRVRDFHARVRQETQFTYAFESFFHPFVGELVSQLNRGALADLLDPVFQQNLADSGFFERDYTPLPSDTVAFEISDGVRYPVKEIDVGAGPYAVYNWELFFHIPLAVAVHLSKNQRFAEAQRWFHHVFDPTCTDRVDPPERFWKFLRFRTKEAVKNIDDVLALWGNPSADPALKRAIQRGYDALLDRPFQPHVVARTRVVAYQYSVVMKYLDNLIAWGDSLFLEDTMESINEATLRYVLAANILGPRPQPIPPRAKARPTTFAEIRKATRDPSGNPWVAMEGQFPFNVTSPPGGGPGDPSLFGIARSLYFCVPRNDKLLAYWDTVADRLFKIRHGMNLQGVARQLALFDPRLDPGMFVKAAAAGIDVAGAIAQAASQIGPPRALFWIQKALELAGEVRGLGNALLSALEKGDGERLALLRQGHELKIQTLSQEVRFLQWKHAEQTTEALLRTRASALERYRYYQRLLGAAPDGNATPDTFSLDRRELTADNFDDAHAALVEQYDKAVAVQAYPPLRFAEGASPSDQSGATSTGPLYLISNEGAELNTHLPRARDLRFHSSLAQAAAPALALIPEITLDLHYWGIGSSPLVLSGPALAQASTYASEGLQILSALEQDAAGLASRTASYQRRADEWRLQHNLAARELMQIGRQILSSLIAEQIARREHQNTQVQIQDTQDVLDQMKAKFTSEELYGWMQGELFRLYYEYYRFAVDTARRAERTMKHELMRPELDRTDFIKLDHWDGGRKGLLSGDALHLDVKRMEMAYHENNTRELELTRHVSLRQLDPAALLSLKLIGKCEFTIPEWLHDLDCPGHYLRRIKTVALSLPAVVGPYTSVHCALTLERSWLRRETGATLDQVAGGAEQIVTSSGTSDSGLFETNLRDDRFLPFEGKGVVSQWKLEVLGEPRPFDTMTITDAILHIRYTARQDDALRDAAKASVKAALGPASETGDAPLALLFSLRHDFPTEWAAFTRSAAAGFSMRLRKDHFPYFAQVGGETLAITRLDLSGAGGTLQQISDANADPADITANLRDKGYADLKIPATLMAPIADSFMIVWYSLKVP